MIESFKSKKLKLLYQSGDGSKIGSDLIGKVERILTVLDAATSEQALDLPSYHLHPLKGELKGFWNVSVSRNWQIIFRLDAGKAQDVDLIDYH